MEKYSNKTGASYSFKIEMLLIIFWKHTFYILLPLSELTIKSFETSIRYLVAHWAQPPRNINSITPILRNTKKHSTISCSWSNNWIESFQTFQHSNDGQNVLIRWWWSWYCRWNMTFWRNIKFCDILYYRIFAGFDLND